jgi:uncharacterized protein YjbI with pentapeptide repeats
LAVNNGWKAGSLRRFLCKKAKTIQFLGQSKSIISDAMKRSKDEPVPRTPPKNVPGIDDLTPVDAEKLLADGRLEESFFQSIDLSGRSIPSLVIWNSIFDNVSFASSKIGKLRLGDVRLIRCDLSNAVLQGFEANRVEFIDCRMIGMRAIECQWQDVLVENCDLRYAQQCDAKIRGSEFKSCNLAEADLRGSNLEGTIFTNVMLHRADLNRAKLRGTDLRGADIEGIAMQPEDLRGAVVSVAQALDLARFLGVVIK